jgi:hypothetical protein
MSLMIRPKAVRDAAECDESLAAAIHGGARLQPRASKVFAFFEECPAATLLSAFIPSDYIERGICG